MRNAFQKWLLSTETGVSRCLSDLTLASEGIVYFYSYTVTFFSTQGGKKLCLD